MSQTAVRSLVAQGVIGLAVCLGGYASIVMPLRERVGAARSELAAVQVQAQEAKAVEGSLASVMERLAAARDEADAIVRAGGMARSQETLYAALSARAGGLGVRIDEFTPIDPGMGGAERAAAAPGEVVLRCRFSATGTYGELARLLRAVSEENGFTVVRSVLLSPDSTGDEVHAEVETEHYAVDPMPRATAGAGEGHP